MTIDEAGIETRYVGQLVADLAEARARLIDRQDEGREVSLDDEKRFAAAWLQRALESIQRSRLNAGEPQLVGDALDLIREQVLETSFHGALLWRTWAEHAMAENLWVQGTDACMIQTGGVTVEVGPVASSSDELRQAVKVGRAESSRPDAPWDHLSHQLEFVMRDGTRVTATDFVCSEPFVTLRRPTLRRVTLDDLVENQTMSESCAQFLTAAVKAKLRILIGGSMNTGKTVLLRALAAALPTDAITVVAESQGELMLKESAGDPYPSFIFELEARKAGADGHGAVSLNRLIEDAQRLSPSCVIVGEVRGEESIALSKALSQGYQVMATIHAYSAIEAVSNAGLYLEQYTNIHTDPALRRIADGVDISVFMEMVNGKRRVAEVAVIDQAIDGVVKADLVFDHVGVMNPLPEKMKRVFARHGYEF